MPAERSRGHLFVVHGRIQDLVHDAAIVPVGSEFRFNQVWEPLVGRRPELPDDWAGRQWGRVFGGPDRVWAVSVGGAVADPYDAILDRIDAVLRRVEERAPKYRVKGGRRLPLVAVPVVGIGRGGYGNDRGEVLAQLVARLARTVRTTAVDVALVTPEPAVFAAAQYARRDHLDPLPDAWERAAHELGELARRRSLAVLMGAGVSVPAELPTWHDLLGKLSRRLGLEELDLPRSTLSATDQAELIEQLAEGRFKQAIVDITGAHRVPSLLHALLAGLDSRQVITTNYDQLYETAVRATGRSIDSVMPWGSAVGADRWVLKLHGDIEHQEQIVLTRRQMVRYDAAQRPSAALLQSLLLTKHLLIVGTSMTDDNVLRLVHEVQEYRDQHQRGGDGTFGTVLDIGGDDVRSRLWAGQLDWISFSSGKADDGARAVELFLDRIGFHAAKDSSWVLDKRFAGLIPDHEARLAEQARALCAALPDRPGTKWEPLVQRLREMGAQG